MYFDSSFGWSGHISNAPLRHSGYHYENTPMKYTEIFKAVKIENCRWEMFDISNILAQNVDCG